MGLGVAAFDRQFYVYILTNKTKSVVYTGVTSDLIGRIYTHRNDLVAGFTRRYRVHSLVWYEHQGSAEGAITREKQIKNWNRAWKDELVTAMNPEWRDLYPEISIHWG